jgi:hypothetical protein
MPVRPTSDPLGAIISATRDLPTDGAGRPIEKAGGRAQHEAWHQVLDLTLQKLTSEETWNGHRSWRAAYELYRGNHWSRDMVELTGLHNESDRLESAFTANYIGSHIQNLIPFLIRRDPYFLIRPTRPGEEAMISASKQEALLNSMWRRQRMTRQIELAAYDFAITGNGFVKTGFTVAEDRPTARSSARRLDYDDFYRSQYPYVRRISPFRLLVDLTAPDQTLSTARWVAEITFKQARDVVENQSYNQKLRGWIANPAASPYDFVTLPQFAERFHDDDGGSLLGWGEDSDPRGEMILDEDILVLVELWDKRSGLYALYPWGVPEPLIERDWPGGEYLRTFPYHHAKFIPVPDELYAVGHAMFTRDPQHLLNRLRTKQSVYLRAFNVQRQGPAISADDLVKLNTQEPNAYIQLPSGDMREISYITPPQLNQDLFRVFDDIKSDLRELSGNDALIAGGALPSRTSATEVNARERIFGLKLEHQVSQIDRLFEEVGTQVLAHLKGNPSSADVTAFDRDHRPVLISPDEIKAEVELEVISTSRPKDDPEIRQQTGLQLLQALATTVPAILQVQAIQRQSGLPVQPVNVDFNPILRYAVEAFESKELEAAIPPMAPAEVPPDLAAAVGGGGNPPGGPNPEDEAAAFRDGRSVVSDFANPGGV